MLFELVDTWRAAGLDPRVHPVSDGYLVTITRGARAVPFDDLGQPLLWLAPEVLAGRSAAELQAWAASDAWNFGAERLWIGPEIDFMVGDRRDFAGSYLLPATMDPGRWTVETAPEAAAEAAAESGTEPAGETAVAGSLPTVFRHEMDMFAHVQRAPLSIEVEQTLAPAADPLGHLAGSKHLGWTREVTLRRTATDAGAAACQAWVLIQADAGATVVVPGAAGARVTDYFEPVDSHHLTRAGEDLVLRLSGTTRYKIGVQSGSHRGQVACWRELEGGRALLLVRSFEDTPSTRYLEQPPAMPEHEGDSVYVYNDDGRHGNFGEVEVLGRALEPDRALVTDKFELHAWWGERRAVLDAAERLLGLSIPASRSSAAS